MPSQQRGPTASQAVGDEPSPPCSMESSWMQSPGLVRAPRCEEDATSGVQGRATVILQVLEHLLHEEELGLLSLEQRRLSRIESM